ncbi:MAG: hypothetical protein K9K67_03565 [Bacteriovoracaceae bacterium]|nr:hypothetical protein [Bacteriovoracaceae bacterium]
MSKKKIYLTDKKKKDLEGFEDVMDLIGQSETEIRSDKEIQIEDYEIFDFLEKEILRLEKIDQFFTTQLPIDKRYSQTKALIEKESGDVALLREEIIDKLKQEESNLNQFMSNLFAKTFN